MTFLTGLLIFWGFLAILMFVFSIVAGFSCYRERDWSSLFIFSLYSLITAGALVLLGLVLEGVFL